MEIWSTPTHPPLRTYINSSLASCILVQFRVCCTCTIRYHQLYMLKACPLRGGAGCIATLANSLIYKKVPQIAVCEQSKSEKLGMLCIFGQRNSLKFRKGSSFVRFAPSEAKQTPEFLQKCPLIQKIRKRSTFEKFAPSSDKNPWYGLGWSQSNA